MGKLVQIRRQYRFVDPDKEKLAANKGKFEWDESEINEAMDEETGLIEGAEDSPVEFIVTCKASGAKKAVAYEIVEIVEDEGEAARFFNSLDGDSKVALVAYYQENRAKESLSAQLMESHESPEKAAKRLERKQGEAAKLTKEWIDEQIAKGQWPTQEQFNEKVRQIHTQLDLPLPTNQQTDED